MSDIDAYLAGLDERLRADGCTVSTAALPHGPALVGRRADFRVRWMLTRVHLFTIAVPQTHVTLAAIQEFTRVAMNLAKDLKGGLPVGLQTGVAVFPVMVGEVLDPHAIAWVYERQRLDFGVLARPTVVDARSGRAHLFRADAALGFIYNRHLRTKAARYLPERWPTTSSELPG